MDNLDLFINSVIKKDNPNASIIKEHFNVSDKIISWIILLNESVNRLESIDSEELDTIIDTLKVMEGKFEVEYDEFMDEYFDNEPETDSQGHMTNPVEIRRTIDFILDFIMDNNMINETFTYGDMFEDERTYIDFPKERFEDDFIISDEFYKRINEILGGLPNPYEIKDIRTGMAKSKDGKKEQKIGKLLKSAGVSDEQLRSYNQRLNQTVKDINIPYQVVFTYNKEDIVRMSTERDWVSCASLAAAAKHALAQIPNKVIGGGMVAYLIKKSDQNIEKPLARIAIRRLINRETGSFTLLPERRVYGIESRGFSNFVAEILEKNNENTADLALSVFEDFEGGYTDTFGGQTGREFTIRGQSIYRMDYDKLKSLLMEVDLFEDESKVRLFETILDLELYNLIKRKHNLYDFVEYFMYERDPDGIMWKYFIGDRFANTRYISMFIEYFQDHIEKQDKEKLTDMMDYIIRVSEYNQTVARFLQIATNTSKKELFDIINDIYNYTEGKIGHIEDKNPRFEILKASSKYNLDMTADEESFQRELKRFFEEYSLDDYASKFWNKQGFQEVKELDLFSIGTMNHSEFKYHVFDFLTNGNKDIINVVNNTMFFLDYSYELDKELPEEEQGDFDVIEENFYLYIIEPVIMRGLIEIVSYSKKDTIRLFSLFDDDDFVDMLSKLKLSNMRNQDIIFYSEKLKRKIKEEIRELFERLQSTHSSRPKVGDIIVTEESMRIKDQDDDDVYVRQGTIFEIIKIEKSVQIEDTSIPVVVIQEYVEQDKDYIDVGDIFVRKEESNTEPSKIQILDTTDMDSGRYPEKVKPVKVRGVGLEPNSPLQGRSFYMNYDEITNEWKKEEDEVDKALESVEQYFTITWYHRYDSYKHTLVPVTNPRNNFSFYNPRFNVDTMNIADEEAINKIKLLMIVIYVGKILLDGINERQMTGFIDSLFEMGMIPIPPKIQNIITEMFNKDYKYYKSDDLHEAVNNIQRDLKGDTISESRTFVRKNKFDTVLENLWID